MGVANCGAFFCRMTASSTAWRPSVGLASRVTFFRSFSLALSIFFRARWIVLGRSFSEPEALVDPDSSSESLSDTTRRCFSCRRLLRDTRAVILSSSASLSALSVCVR